MSYPSCCAQSASFAFHCNEKPNAKRITHTSRSEYTPQIDWEHVYPGLTALKGAHCLAVLLTFVLTVAKSLRFECAFRHKY